MRVLLPSEPYPHLNSPTTDLWQRGLWPAKWLTLPPSLCPTPPFVSAYRLRFTLDHPTTARLHISADERYELFLDGSPLGRGPERGDPQHWFFESYDLPLTPGPHTLVARVWSLGPAAPYAQMSTSHPAFLAAADDPALTPLLSTGQAKWECKLLPGYTHTPADPIAGTGHKLTIDGSQYPWGVERGDGPDWLPAPADEQPFNPLTANEYPRTGNVPHGHFLRHATLPAMMDEPRSIGTARHVSNVPSPDTSTLPIDPSKNLPQECTAWTSLLQHTTPLTIPPHTTRRILIDLENYYCAYSHLTTTGGRGSSLRLLWSESLYDQPTHQSKSNRNTIDHKFFTGFGDTFLPDGGPRRTFSPLWWSAGRYLETLVQTADQPLTIESLSLHETRYPLEMESHFQSDSPDLNATLPLCLRGLQMSSHETYIDCPYYEQLQYAGDTRLECLTTYAISRDPRLPLKALHMFDASRTMAGLTTSRYPSRVRQYIAPFSLWWVGMVHDHLFWRGNEGEIRAFLSGIRQILNSYVEFRDPSDGLVHRPFGWNFMDWVPGWPYGTPPFADQASPLLNFHFVYTLNLAAQLEDHLGEPELAARYRRHAKELTQSLTHHFWDEKRHLFSEDTAHTIFTEHTQCLAILSDQLDPHHQQLVGDALFTAPDLARTTIYFSHYLFETAQKLGRIAPLFKRLPLWYSLAPQGFKTTPEQPEPTRSDCHGWGSHPLYHYFSTLAGIRPSSPGFQSVSIRPQPGPLKKISAQLVHPQGLISLDLDFSTPTPQGTITLPPNTPGTLHLPSTPHTPLNPGRNDLPEKT